MKSARLWLAFTLFCIFAVPAAVFLGGLWLAGPYEGENGYLGMLGNLYGDALTGNIGALTLLLSPVAIIAAWRLAFLARNWVSDADEPAETAQGQ